jgi:hypothetical protein
VATLPHSELDWKGTAMICDWCGKLVRQGIDIYVVIKWGKKDPVLPDFLGKPAEIVDHSYCNKERRSKMPRVSEPKEQPRESMTISQHVKRKK